MELIRNLTEPKNSIIYTDSENIFRFLVSMKKKGIIAEIKSHPETTLI